MNAEALAPADDRLSGHGGRLCVARALHPHAPQPWIDLSTGINPKPYPAPRASASARARLPEPRELAALEEAAARAFGVEDAERVVAAGGSEAVLRLMPYALQATPSGHDPNPVVREALVVGPTYSSHADAWRKAGARLKHVTAIEPASPLPAAGEGQGEGFLQWQWPITLTRPSGSTSPATGRGDEGAASSAAAPGQVKTYTVLTVVNPNNPDGAVIPRGHLLSLHDDLATRDSFLIIDEAFADSEPSNSVAALAGSERYEHLIVLRSFGKFYGLAGLRLGFVIAAPAIARRFRSLLGDWPVAADAIAAGLAAYPDAAWAERTRARLRTAARRLDALLVRSGFEIIGGTTLFRLARSNLARARFEQLLRAGILVRPFDHDPTLLRFGLPHGEVAWQRLGAALRPNS